jgi:hypothetical protein
MAINPAAAPALDLSKERRVKADFDQAMDSLLQGTMLTRGADQP